MLVIGAVFFYWRSTFTEDTDDAQVDGNLYQVSSRITGHVIKVYVDDNQTVQAGQPLAEIDPTDYQVALDQAQADLANAQAQYVAGHHQRAHHQRQRRHQRQHLRLRREGGRPTRSPRQRSRSPPPTRASNKPRPTQRRPQPTSTATRRWCRRTSSPNSSSTQPSPGRRAQGLRPRSRGQRTRPAERRLERRVAAGAGPAQSQQSVQNGPGQVRVEQSRAAAAAAAVKQAQARVEQAQLNLSYTHITAPTAGIVNKKNVEVGANLSIGQDLMTIIPLTDLWVTANFKETQLAQMRPCQPVTIKVDAYGGRKFSGKITQIGGATGSMLSLFPPENATGNYVKVVQRIPVRIDFTNLAQEDGDYVLRPGLSVTPDVEVKAPDVPNCTPGK